MSDAIDRALAEIEKVQQLIRELDAGRERGLSWTKEEAEFIIKCEFEGLDPIISWGEGETLAIVRSSRSPSHAVALDVAALGLPWRAKNAADALRNALAEIVP